MLRICDLSHSPDREQPKGRDLALGRCSDSMSWQRKKDLKTILITPRTVPGWLWTEREWGNLGIFRADFWSAMILVQFLFQIFLSKCFPVVLEKTLQSPLDCKEIKPVNLKGNQPWIFIGRTDAEAEAPILWPPDAKSQLLEKTTMLGKIEGRRRSGWQRRRWLDGITDSMDMSLSKP